MKIKLRLPPCWINFFKAFKIWKNIFIKHIYIPICILYVTFTISNGITYFRGDNNTFHLKIVVTYILPRSNQLSATS